MELDEFCAALDTLTAADLRRVAHSLESETLTDEVDWWRATIAIDRAIRYRRCGRQAARAAAAAAALVQRVAAREGIELPDPAVTRVARAAAEIARGIAAGPPAQTLVGVLLGHWNPLVPA